MGTSVVLGESSLTVKRGQVAGFKATLVKLGLDEHLKLKKNRTGDVVGLELKTDRLIEREELEALHPFVETGSFVDQESEWGDDAWRYTFTKTGILECTIA